MQYICITCLDVGWKHNTTHANAYYCVYNILVRDNIAGNLNANLYYIIFLFFVVQQQQQPNRKEIYDEMEKVKNKRMSNEGFTSRLSNMMVYLVL